MSEVKRKRLGVALSGGGARGLVHIGVLQGLESAGIKVDFLAGTSMGGLIAAGYAAGLSPAEMAELARTHGLRLRSLWRFVDLGRNRQGLIRGEQVETWVRNVLGQKTFADLDIPLTLMATDLNAGREVRLTEGCLASAVRATMSIPGLLAPVMRDGMRLVDGGLLNNLPVDVVRQMGADIVIGVDVYSDNAASFWQYVARKRLVATTVGGIIANLGDALNLVIRAHSVYRFEKYPPDFFLKPPIPPQITVISGYDHAEELIALGKSSVEAILPALREALNAAA